MVQPILTENHDKIVELCRAHHVCRLSVFGSAVRDDFDPTRSDVDFLVDFTRTPEMHYAKNFFALQKSLAQLLEREVDLVIDGSLSNTRLRKIIAEEAELLYAA